MKQEHWVENKQGEKLSVWVEGRDDATITVLMVHGFGIGKHDAHFDDTTAALSKQYRVVRFDFSSYGESEGQNEDATYDKQADEVNLMVEWAKKQFGGDVYIIAQSMGCHAVSIAAPENIKKTVYTAPAPALGEDVIKGVQDKIRRREGVIDEDGISIYPRSSVPTQKLGPGFWKSIRSHDLVELFANYVQKTSLLLIRPMSDEVVSKEGFAPFRGVDGYILAEIEGDHSFQVEGQRQATLDHITAFFDE